MMQFRAGHYKLSARSQYADSFEHADHAGAALHDGGKGRHLRHPAPDSKVDWAFHARRHRLSRRHREGDRVAVGERAIDIGVRAPAANHTARCSNVMGFLLPTTCSPSVAAPRNRGRPAALGARAADLYKQY
jgi:hypothetical protein